VTWSLIEQTLDNPQGGKTVQVSPHTTNNDDDEIVLRRVKIIGQSGKLFMGKLGVDSKGWLRQSVLGTWFAATEDGDQPIFTIPTELPRQISLGKNGTLM
jgi:hypothetical protein